MFPFPRRHADSQRQWVLASPAVCGFAFNLLSEGRENRGQGHVERWTRAGRRGKCAVPSPRPSVKLMNKSVHSEGSPSVVQLSSQDELPEHAKLTFFVQAITPGGISAESEDRNSQHGRSFSTILRVGRRRHRFAGQQDSLGDTGSGEGVRRFRIRSSAFPANQRGRRAG